METTSMIGGNFNSQVKENHIFISEDKDLVDLGISYLTRRGSVFYKMRDSILASVGSNLVQGADGKMYGQSNINPGIFGVFGGMSFFSAIHATGGESGIADGPGNIVFSFEGFDRNTKKHRSWNSTKNLSQLQSPKQLDDLIAYHEKVQQTPPSQLIRNPFYDKLILDIQNSLGGCLVLTFPIHRLLRGDKARDGNFTYKLYLHHRKKRDFRRILSHAGAPMITDVPRRPAGPQYAFKKTQSHQTSSHLNIGSYLNPDEGGLNNPKNTVTAPLRLSYNSTDCVFEVANQMLVRLLTDLAAAPITKLVPPTEVIGTSNLDFYDIDGAYYMGQFTTALAIPLSIENGNPHMFGPNIVECKDKKLEKVRVVNRSTKPYEAGEVVMANYINGEWVVSSLGEATIENKKASVSEWAFVKLMVNSDGFFKDDRYFSDDQNWNSYSQSILPSVYEEKTRNMLYGGPNQFSFLTPLQNIALYTHPEFAEEVDDDATDEEEKEAEKKQGQNINTFLTKFINWNLPNKSNELVIPSRLYIASTVFDQLPLEAGGRINPNEVYKTTDGQGSSLIKVTNVLDASVVDPGDLGSAQVVFPFWGPVYTRGHSTIDTLNRDYNVRNHSADGLGLNYFFNELDDYDISYINKLHIPAELTSKIINTIYVKNEYNVNNLARNSLRNNLIKTPYHNSEQVSKNEILFIPLSDGLVGHTDAYSPWGIWEGRRFMKNIAGLPLDFNPGVPIITGLRDGEGAFVNHILGFTSTREVTFHQPDPDLDFFNDQFLSPEYFQHPNKDYVTRFSPTYRVFLPAYPNIPIRNYEFASPLLRYDVYKKRPSTSSPLGAPQWFEDSEDIGANFVGIIAGMAKIVKNGGGDINFSVNQSVGLNQLGTAITVTSSNLAIIAGMAPIVLETGETTNILNPQWGSSTDSIDSFGTTALHCRIFDSWPDEDKFYDPRYFSVLHFNPIGSGTKNGGPFGDYEVTDDNPIENKQPENFGALPKYKVLGATKQEIIDIYGEEDPLLSDVAYSNIPRRVDIEETNVDIRIPTFDSTYYDGYGANPEAKLFDRIGGWNDEGASNKIDTGIIASNGALISSESKLRPQTEWAIDPIRRGQLLTNGGFYYTYKTIGLIKLDCLIVDPGTNFIVKDDESIDLDRDISVIVTDLDDNGGLGDFEFKKIIPNTDPLYKFATNGAIESRGVGFLPSDFSSDSSQIAGFKCFRLTVPSNGENGNPAIIECYTGIVYERLAHDEGPTEQAPLTRLSLSSKRGASRSQGTLDQALNVGSNDSGSYDLFTFFHNDITHTLYNTDVGDGGFAQYINLTIT